MILYEIGSVELLEKTRAEAAEYYAFAMCSSDVIKDRALFEKVSGFIYRDDVFDALITNGFDMREAYSVSRLWSRGEQRQAEIDLLRERGAPEELINAFRHLTNLWTRTECLSRTNMMQTLKYYEINFPDEYGKVTGRS